MKQITFLIQQEVMLVKGNIMDICLFIFVINDASCKGFDVGSVVEIGFVVM